MRVSRENRGLRRKPLEGKNSLRASADRRRQPTAQHRENATMQRRKLLTTALGVGAVAALATIAGLAPAQAQDKTVTIGIELPLTGADADGATRIKNGALMAIDDTNAAGGAGGYKLQASVLDSGTSTAGQYDPAQAATNAKKFVSDPSVVALVGPEMSGEGKAMTPILSAANLATVTPSSTNPDITDPKFAAQYKPNGKAIYFRTVTTDAYQGPNMANYMRDTLHVKSVYILDDSGAYGVGMSNAYEAQAKKIGMNVMGHDQLDPKEADYTTVLTKIKGLNPDAVYYGGVSQAAVKVAKQLYDIMPNVIKCGGDGMVDGGILSAVGFPAIEGWYATQATPDALDTPSNSDWVARYTKTYNMTPSLYSITAYDAVMVVADAIKRVAASGQPVNRDTVRDAIQQSNTKTLQGSVSFDENGDITSKVISVWQIHHDPSKPEDDVAHQFKYIGDAPQSPAS
jgi:branched-chain amino acid transport system substrate-binding protein